MNGRNSFSFKPILRSNCKYDVLTPRMRSKWFLQVVLPAFTLKKNLNNLLIEQNNFENISRSIDTRLDKLPFVFGSTESYGKNQNTKICSCLQRLHLQVGGMDFVEFRFYNIPLYFVFFADFQISLVPLSADYKRVS